MTATLDKAERLSQEAFVTRDGLARGLAPPEPFGPLQPVAARSRRRRARCAAPRRRTTARPPTAPPRGRRRRPPPPGRALTPPRAASGTIWRRLGWPFPSPPASPGVACDPARIGSARRSSRRP